MGGKLVVNEIFRSLQGEGTRAGAPCTFVRLTGCNLRCNWCDTQYAWEDGREMSVEEVLAEVEKLAVRRVEVTGGEPLVQPAATDLLKCLCDQGYETLLETNGSVLISAVDPRVVRIVDFKCPSSGQSDANRWENVHCLTPRDEVKFVVANRTDFDYAAGHVRRDDLTRKCVVLLSPVHGRLGPDTLAEWILEAGLDVRLAVQLHKMLWPERQRGA